MLKMKILLIIPGINKKYNDNAHSYIYMRNQGVDICVISNRLRTTKGPGIEEPYECMDGINIYRIYDDFTEQSSFLTKKYNKIYKIVKNFQPDLIFCSQQKNMNLAVKIKKNFGIPIVLLVEFAYDPKNPLKLIGFGEDKLPVFFSRALANIYWRWLSKHSSAIITCYPGDKTNIDKLSTNCTKTHYVPWPSYSNSTSKKIKKERGRGIYIGALSEHKNILEFNSTLQKIFEHTPTEEFYIVGSGKYQYVVDSLQKRYPNKIKHIPSVERDKALHLIKSSYYAYAPMKYGGWGFIGDCWAMKTPIIATNNDYTLINRIDSLITSKKNIADTIKLIYNDNQLYKKLQNGGYERFKRYHTAEAVGEKYLEIVNLALDN